MDPVRQIHKASSGVLVSVRERHLGDEECASVLAACREAGPNQPSVVSIDVASNNLTPDGSALRALAQVIASAPLLESVCLEWNRVGCPFHLAEAAADSSSLTSLDLRSTGVGNEDATHLAYCIQQSATLKQLDLRFNQIGASGGQALVDAMQHNSSLLHLDLAGNEVPFRLLQAVEDCLVKNRLLAEHTEAVEKEMAIENVVERSLTERKRVLEDSFAARDAVSQGLMDREVALRHAAETQTAHNVQVAQEMQRALAQEQAQHTAHVSQLTSERDTLQVSLTCQQEECTLHCKRYEDEISVLTAALASERTSRAEVEATLTLSRQENIREREKLRAKHNKQLQEMAQTNTRLQGQLDDAAHRIAALQHELALVNLENARLARRRFIDADSEIKSLNDRVSNAEERRSKWESQVLGQMSAEVSVAQLELEAAQRKVIEMEESKAKQEAEDRPAAVHHVESLHTLSAADLDTDDTE